MRRAGRPPAEGHLSDLKCQLCVSPSFEGRMPGPAMRHARRVRTRGGHGIIACQIGPFSAFPGGPFSPPSFLLFQAELDAGSE